MTSVVVDFLVVVVGFTASTVVAVGISTVVVKEESVPAIHNGRVRKTMQVLCTW